MTTPVNHWKRERDYYSRKDYRYAKHIAEIDAQNRIDARVDASAGDHSYSVMIARKDISK